MTIERTIIFFNVFVIVTFELQESPVIFRPEYYFYDAWL